MAARYHPPPPTRYGSPRPPDRSGVAVQPAAARPTRAPSLPPGPPPLAAAGLVQPRRPGLVLPPGAGLPGRGTVQCAHAQELHAGSEAVWKLGRHLQNAIREVQILLVNGRRIYSANNSVETTSLETVIGNARGKGDVILAKTPKAAYTAAANPTKLVILEGDSGSAPMHAEQNLLRVVDHLLQTGTAITGTVEVWGVKTPCTTCRKVLNAFAAALNARFNTTLEYEGSGAVIFDGIKPYKTDGEFDPLTLGPLAPEAGLAYQQFHADYEGTRPKTMAELEQIKTQDLKEEFKKKQLETVSSFTPPPNKVTKRFTTTNSTSNIAVSGSKITSIKKSPKKTGYSGKQYLFGFIAFALMAWFMYSMMQGPAATKKV